MNTRNLCLAGAVAAMLAIAPLTARADYASTTTTSNGAVTTVTTPTATTTVITTPNMSSAYNSASGADSLTPSQQQAMVNYRLLTNKCFDGVDLAQASASGLSDKQIGVAAKVSRLAGVPFKQVAGDLLRGDTYYQLADRYNLRDSDIYNSTEDEAMVAQYKMAYASTGSMAITKVAGDQMAMSSASGTTMMTDKNIVQTLRSSGNYTMLTSALKKTHMLSTLRGSGPFTIFAPTDAAFAKLSPADVDYLMKNEDKLSQVLSYHVIPARIDAATAMSMTTPTSPATVEGDTLQVTTTGGHVMINNATVVQPDILCTNGVIHGIDTVLVPSSVTLP